MNNPVFLPKDPLWLSVGYGKPLGLNWAAFNTATIGGRWKSIRGAASIWISGDDLYSERIASVAIAHVIHQLTAGLAISYYNIDIEDFPSDQGQVIIDGALAASPGANIDISVWYGRQTLRREDSYTNATRQIFQIVATREIGQALSGSIAFEKTPPFALCQRAEITIASQQDLRIHLGYRTVPETLSVGIQIPVGRTAFSFRLMAHPTLGLSTAIGLAYK